MAEKVAFAKKASAETRLKVAMKDLSEKVDQDNGTAPTEQFLSRSIATLATHWISFENAHNSHVELVDLEATVPLLEAYGRVASKYDEVVEKGEALRASRLPQAPVARLPTLEEQYEVAYGMRETTFGEVDDAIAGVADYFKEKREETAVSLENQRQELRRAEGLLKEARVYTDTMATMMPEHALRDRTADSAKEREVMKLVSGHMRVLSLLSTATPPAAGVSSRDSSYMYSRRPLPSFGGARRDYPSFRREWQSNVTGNFSVEYELREIKQNCPAEVEPDLKNLKSMKDVWDFLDRKYGRTMELASELINGLHNFKFSTKAKTESARFAELDREWTKVYYDLEEVDKLSALDHEPTLARFAHKLPSVEAKKAYGVLRIKMDQECRNANPPTEVSELKVMKAFMKAERERQEVFAGLLDDGDVKPKDNLRQGGRVDPCSRCGRAGHQLSECPGQGDWSRTSHATRAASAPCPACKEFHTFTGGDGIARPSTKLGFCTTFRSLGVDERVALMEEANGCAVCLDCTGRHQREGCYTQDSDGQPRTCTEMENGKTCGKRHHYLLHGSTSTSGFSGFTQGGQVHVTDVPRVRNTAPKEKLLRPLDVESEEDVDFISWEIYKENLEWVGKEKQVKMSHHTTRQGASQVLEEMKGEKVEKFADAGQPLIEPRVPYTVEQRQLLAEAESWGEEDAEPGLHVELVPASKELMAEVEAWDHKDDAEEPSYAPKEEAEGAEVFIKLWHQAWDEVDCLARKLASAKREAEETEVISKALAEEDCLSMKPAISACCDEEKLVQEKKEQYKEVPLMIKKQEELVQEKKEQYMEVPLMIKKQDLVGMSVSMQVEGVSGVKAEAETMVGRRHSTMMEGMRLKEEKVTGGEKDWHELSPLVADKLLPPDREGSRAEARTSVD